MVRSEPTLLRGSRAAIAGVLDGCSQAVDEALKNRFNAIGDGEW